MHVVEMVKCMAVINTIWRRVWTCRVALNVDGQMQSLRMHVVAVVGAIKCHMNICHLVHCL